jgi:hypothetical protein
MKHLTLYIIFVLLPLAGLMGQSCPDTIKLSIVTKFDGQDIGVDILVDNFKNIEGFQFGFNYDADFMRLKLLSSSIPSFDADNFSDNKKGNVRFFWLNSNSETLANGTTLISMKFTPLQLSSTAFVDISPNQFPLEFINTTLQSLCVKTDHKTIQSDGHHITGKVVFDQIGNCQTDDSENGLSDWLIEMNYLGKSYYRTTKIDGSYSFTVPNGIYTIRAINKNEYWQICDDIITVEVAGQDVNDQNFYAQEFKPCYKIKTDISTPLLQRCKDNVYHIIYENQGNTIADNAQLTVDFDAEYMQFVHADNANFALSNGKITFDLGDLPVNQIDTILLTLHLLCDNTIIGQTHCVTATASPNEPCIINPDWSGAQLEVTSTCDRQNNKVLFTVRNIGNGDMKNPKSYIVTEDDVMRPPKTIKVDKLQSVDIELPANGKTYRLMATQDDGFPYESTIVTDAIEACGTNSSGKFSTGYVNIFEESDRDLFVDSDCQTSVSDLTFSEIIGYPLGYGQEHFINKGTNLDYMVRFDNPSLDTIHSVIVKCQIPPSLDITTLQMGTSSHDYSFQFNQERDLVVTFENIILPDSASSQGQSYGYFKFRIKPVSTLNNGDSIQMLARVLYDYYTPVLTQPIFHIIGTDFIISGTDWLGEPLDMAFYPNPAHDELMIDTKDVNFSNGSYALYNQYGQMIRQQNLDKGINKVACGTMCNGVYFVKINLENQAVATVRLVKL